MAGDTQMPDVNGHLLACKVGDIINEIAACINRAGWLECNTCNAYMQVVKLCAAMLGAYASGVYVSCSCCSSLRKKVMCRSGSGMPYMLACRSGQKFFSVTSMCCLKWHLAYGIGRLHHAICCVRNPIAAWSTLIQCLQLCKPLCLWDSLHARQTTRQAQKTCAQKQRL